MIRAQFSPCSLLTASPRKGKKSAQTCGRQTRRFDMKIVVIGGAGLIGTKLVNNLRQRGQEVVAASPSSGVNTFTGEGLAEALTGAQVVVDVANAPLKGKRFGCRLDLCSPSRRMMSPPP